MRDICVDGVCRDIPCDLQFDSNSVEDACGICHGNGTSCKILQGQANFQKGVSQILNIPAGTRNIVVEENKHTPSHLLLKSTEENDIINEGNKLGMFNISGSMAWLGMKKPNQEVIEIPGPLAHPVEVWITSEGPQSVTYSMGLPSEPREGKYSWDYLDWSPCLAQCGDSYQESVPKCVELLSGHVEDKYCSQVQKPPIKKRSCNAGICLPRWLVGEWQECGPCPSNEARRFRIVRCIKPTAGSEEGMMIVSDKVCPGSRPVGSEPCRCIKRQVLYWPSPYRFDMLSNDFKILSTLNKGNKTSKIPEKKVTLMQLENENEESMLKQFKENQQKHHSIFYMPRVLGSRFNFSIPFKKREAILDENHSQGSFHLSNSNFLDYFPKKLNAVDFIKSGNIIMGNNHVQTTQAVKFFSLSGPRDNINSLNVKRLRPISTNDPQPLLFSDQNILKLLSENLPLDRLKQQQNMNRNTENPFKNFIYFPDIYLNDTGLTHPKEEKKLNIIDILMNEFNSVLATDTLAQSNTKNPLTTDSDILSLQGIAIKPKGSVLENRIQFSKQPFLLSNASSLDEAIARLQMAKPINEISNASNNFTKIKLNNYGGNNQRATESWIPPNGREWNKLLNAFRRYFFKKQYESELNSASTAINDQQPKIDDNIYLVSTQPTKTNATNNNLNSLGSLTRKVIEKLNTLSDSDKLKAYQLFRALVNNLHDTLSAFPQKEHAQKDVFLNDDTSFQEIKLMPMRGDSFENEINRIKSLDFFDRINNDLLRFNRSKDSVLNYSLPKFDKPIFSEADLLKIKQIFNLGDKARLVDSMNRNEIPKFYQLKIRNKQKGIQDEIAGENNKNAIENEQMPESNTKSILNHNLDEFITSFISGHHKGDKGRNKKEVVGRLNAHHKGRIERYVQLCPKGSTDGRRITGIYRLPTCRVCPKSTTSPHPKYAIPRCRKNVANVSCDINKKTFGKESFKKRAIFLPGYSKLVKFTGRKKRFKPCEESTRICEELMRRFKDRLANATNLDPYSCQRLREEILHVKFNLKSEENLQNDLYNVINSNATCIFLYSDEKDTTTPFHF